MLSSIKIIMISLAIIFNMYQIKQEVNGTDYSVNIESYNLNGSHIEYPQVNGMDCVALQDKINKLLKKEITAGAINEMIDKVVDFSRTNVEYQFKSGIGFTNKNIASFWYSFVCYDKNSIGAPYWFYTITINMNTGKKIELWDFMNIDENLINSGIKDKPKPDYNGVFSPQLYTFKDAFEIYSLPKEKDSFHQNTPDYIISELKDPNYTTIWLIAKNKDLQFYSDWTKSIVTIPFSQLKDSIHPKYLKLLEEPPE